MAQVFVLLWSQIVLGLLVGFLLDHNAETEGSGTVHRLFTTIAVREERAGSQWVVWSEGVKHTGEQVQLPAEWRDAEDSAHKGGKHMSMRQKSNSRAKAHTNVATVEEHGQQKCESRA